MLPQARAVVLDLDEVEDIGAGLFVGLPDGGPDLRLQEAEEAPVEGPADVIPMYLPTASTVLPHENENDAEQQQSLDTESRSPPRTHRPAAGPRAGGARLLLVWVVDCAEPRVHGRWVRWACGLELVAGGNRG